MILLAAAVTRTWQLPLWIAIPIGALSFAAADVEAMMRSVPPSIPQAVEVYLWLHRREVARLPRESRPVPKTQSEAVVWLEHERQEAISDLLRIELLCWVGRFEEARQVAERLPTQTPIEKFNKRAHQDYVDWMAGLDPDPGALLMAARDSGLADGDRSEAAVVAALHETRARLVAHAAAWLDPLREARAQVPDSEIVSYRRMVAFPLYRRSLAVGIVLAVFVMAWR
jgi:hypothetical protein